MGTPDRGRPPPGGEIRAGRAGGHPSGPRGHPHTALRSTTFGKSTGTPQGDVDVVGEQVQRHVRDQLHDRLVVEAHRPQRVHVRVGDLGALAHQLLAELQRRPGARVVRVPGLGLAHVLGGHPGLAAERGVRGQAVLAGVAVGDQDGDLLAQPRAELALAEGAETGPHHLQRGGGVRDGLEHRGRHAERAGHLVQQRLGLAGRGLGVDQLHTGHLLLLLWWNSGCGKPRGPSWITREWGRPGGGTGRPTGRTGGRAAGRPTARAVPRGARAGAGSRPGRRGRR